MWRPAPTDPNGAVDITGMSTMPLEPDSPDPDPFTSEQWQTDGGSLLEMVVDGRCWLPETVADLRMKLGAATDVACETCGWPALEVGALLCDDARMSELNSQFRGKPAPTNVLSFPSDGGTAPQAGSAAPGEIAIAFETVRDEAIRDGKTFGDHITHLWVHGLLHLMGFDHETDADAEVMEGTETRLLAKLGIADPYASMNGGTIS